MFFPLPEVLDIFKLLLREIAPIAIRHRGNRHQPYSFNFNLLLFS